MIKNQLTRGQTRRVMYIENKDGLIDTSAARIGWVSFSKTGRTMYYQGKTLQVATSGGISGNFFDTETGENYWISGIKKRGSNAHPAESTKPVIDQDAIEEYERIRVTG
jgi:hypothetical protein